MSTQQNKQQNKQQQETIYALIPDNSSWEDIIIFISFKEAETALNNDFPQRRIEHFVKSDKSGGYIPSYLVTYGKNWGLNNQTQTQTQTQTVIEDNLPIFTKYYQVSDLSDHKCSLR